MFVETQAALREFDSVRRRLCTALKAVFVDTSIPLDDRWSLFCTATDLKILSINPWTSHLLDPFVENRGGVSWYDDFYVDRHQTVYWRSIIETIADGEEDFNYCQSLSPEQRKKEFPYGEPDGRFLAVLPQIKEAILANGTAGFIHDW